MMHENTVESIN